ncbi:MAG: hypothetical protein Q4D60_06910 [Eubacteriales bacterium]|nr:hypothetical protein [Eubacteriales bacterium]
MKQGYFLPVLCFFLFLFSSPVHAFEHGYTLDSDTISATVRNDCAIYDSIGGDLITYLPSFSGLTVTGTSGSWYEVRYKNKSGTHYGWMTKDDFTYDCLIYDGREKQILADGYYTFRYYRQKNKRTSSALTSIEKLNAVSEVSFPCRITFMGDGAFQVCRKDTGQYLLPDRLFQSGSSSRPWGDASCAGLFRFVRRGNYYGIQDVSTNRYFGMDKSGLLNFTNKVDASWRLNRTKKSVDSSSLRVFTQFDADWAGTYYGKGRNPDPASNNFCTSGCGVFSTMNAIYALTGQYVDPHILADFAVDAHYRIEDNGTDIGFFKAAAQKFGYKYGFAYDGSGDSFSQLKQKLKQGDTAIAYVPGHYGAIVDYDAKKNQYLFLDSRYLPKRGTCSFGDWVSEKDLTAGGLYAQMFFYYKAIGQ